MVIDTTYLDNALVNTIKYMKPPFKITRKTKPILLDVILTFVSKLAMKRNLVSLKS